MLGSLRKRGEQRKGRGGGDVLGLPLGEPLAGTLKDRNTGLHPEPSR